MKTRFWTWISSAMDDPRLPVPPKHIVWYRQPVLTFRLLLWPVAVVRATPPEDREAVKAMFRDAIKAQKEKDRG